MWCIKELCLWKLEKILDWRGSGREVGCQTEVMIKWWRTSLNCNTAMQNTWDTQDANCPIYSDHPCPCYRPGFLETNKEDGDQRFMCLWRRAENNWVKTACKRIHLETHKGWNCTISSAMYVWKAYNYIALDIAPFGLSIRRMSWIECKTTVNVWNWSNAFT